MEIHGHRDPVVLSARLQMLANMVTPGNRLVDVGCDHGFLSVYLVQAGLCPGAIAMDVRKGPLAGARRHVEEYGLGDYITLRLSDGLEAYRAGEADTLVCAGMGGRLMERILGEGMDGIKGMQELILQPQSELPQFRAFLGKAGLQVIEEDAVCEEGKYYFAIKVRPGQNQGRAKTGALLQQYDMFGEFLLKGRHPVLLAFLQQRRSYLGRLVAALEKASSDKAKERLKEVQEELTQIERALGYYK